MHAFSEQSVAVQAGQAKNSRHISSFADKSLSSGLFLGQLLAAVQPGALDMALLTPGDSPRDLELNAKYIISTARKMGCFIFLVQPLL